MLVHNINRGKVHVVHVWFDPPPLLSYKNGISQSRIGDRIVYKLFYLSQILIIQGLSKSSVFSPLIKRGIVPLFTEWKNCWKLYFSIKMGTSFYCTPPPLRLSAGICTVCLSIYLSLTDKNEIQNTYRNSRKMAQWVAPIN